MIKKRGRPKKIENQILDIQENDNPIILPSGKPKEFEEICKLLLDDGLELSDNHKYVSYSALSAITGIATTVLYQQEKQGKLVSEFVGGTKVLNLNSENMREYFSRRREFVRNKLKRLNLADDVQSGKRGRFKDNFLNNTDESEEIIPRAELAKIRKDEVAAKLGEVKFQKELNKLVLREFCENVFVLFGKTIREMLLPQGQRLAPLIGGIFESTDPEKIRAVQIKIDEENGRCVSDVIGIVERGILTDDELYGDIPEVNIEEIEDIKEEKEVDYEYNR